MASFSMTELIIFEHLKFFISRLFANAIVQSYIMFFSDDIDRITAGNTRDKCPAGCRQLQMLSEFLACLPLCLGNTLSLIIVLGPSVSMVEMCSCFLILILFFIFLSFLWCLYCAFISVISPQCT